MNQNVKNISDVGAGGQQEPYLVNGANSLTFGIMVFGCSLFAILANKVGLKTVLIFGTLGYISGKDKEGRPVV